MLGFGWGSVEFGNGMELVMFLGWVRFRASCCAKGVYVDFIIIDRIKRDKFSFFCSIFFPISF